MIGAIVLAAGQSRRMGTQKLLLPWAGTTLVRHVVVELLQSSVNPVIVVVSDEHGAVAKELAGVPVSLAVNPEPDSEMLESVRCGLRGLPPACEAAMIVMGDQPNIRGALVNKIIRQYRDCGKGLVMPCAGGKNGHPLTMQSRYFSEVLSMFDGIGVCGLLTAHPRRCRAIGNRRRSVSHRYRLSGRLPASARSTEASIDNSTTIAAHFPLSHPSSPARKLQLFSA